MIINATDLGTLVISQPSSELPPIRISLNVAVGGSLPAGGTVRQILRKSSSAPYDVEWSNDQDAQWGQVVGTITAQADLMALLAAKQSVSGMSNYLTLSQALAGYYPLNNPAGYVTASAIDDFLTTTEASAIYQTQANMVSYITDAEAAIKLEPYFYPRYSNPENYISAINAANTFYPLHTNPANYATQSWVTGQNYLTASALTGYATQSWVGSQGFLTASALTGYATESWVTGRGYITAAALSGYATLSGATFGGKVNHTSVGGAAGVNIGIGGTATSATVAGDLWIATGGSNLNFRDATGAWRVVATQGQTNSFTTNQIISGSSASSMLRVTQTGTGEALRIEDEANPDSTPFVVGADGRVGIHGTPATNTNHKLAIYNGNIVFSQGYGLAFGDGTTQVTAATPFDPAGYATESWVGAQGYVVNGVTNDPQFYNSVRIKNDGVPDAVFGTGGLSIQDAASMYGSSGVGLSTGSGFGHSLAVFPNFPSVSLSAGNGLSITDNGSTTVVNGGTLTFNGSEPYARKDGATFSGKVNLAQPSAANSSLNIGKIDSTAILTNSVAGDLWIGRFQLTYKNAQGNVVYGAATNLANVFGAPQIIDTTNSAPALRITQKGTTAGLSRALVVEDSLSPDQNCFIIDQSGNVGVGVSNDPLTPWVAGSSKVEVVGNVKSDTFSNGSGPTFSINSLASHTGGSDTIDAIITIGGVQYRMGLRPV